MLAFTAVPVIMAVAAVAALLGLRAAANSGWPGAG
jgi:hypothetical protein